MMAHLVKSKTPDSDKNFWATTWECFADAQALYGRRFECDVAAEPLTSKCSKYFASPQIVDSLLRNRWETAVMLHHAETQLGNTCVGLDALNLNWPEHWFCNPPFDLKGPFIGHAKWQQQQGRPGMMLLPYERQTDWWRKGISKGCIIYEPDGRYNFMERDGKTKKSGVNFGSALVCFPAFHLHESITVPFTRGIGSKLVA